MRPDVALISPYPRPGVRHGGSSGVASYTANLAEALAGAGAEVTVVAPVEPGAPADQRDGRVRVQRRFALGARALDRAVRAACATGARTVHLQHETFLYGGPTAVPGLVAALRRLRRGRGGRVGSVVTMHHVVAPGAVDARFIRLHRVRTPAAVARAGLAVVRESVRRQADAVVVHEPAFAAAVPGATVVPHGIEVAATTERAAARRALGVRDDRLTVLCFGFVAPYKGLEMALDAARHAGDAVQVVVAGGPHPRVGDAYAAGLRREHGDHARFTGRVPDADVAAWFAAADVALFAYPQPVSSSGALALALAHGTPVLLSPELAACAGAPARLVAPRDPRALAGALRTLVGDRAGLGELAATARTMTADREWPAVARRHLELYARVAGRAGPESEVARAGQAWGPGA
ncbi:MAG: glycosyltransferase [Solirubrobacteraceae bacterium]